MTDITTPLRLAVGSHTAGSGKGCAMNVVSWENGDAMISDLPPCADAMLAKIVQRVNDSHCIHRDGSDLLCPPCSLEVLALAHRTVGTRLDLPAAERARVYVEIAVEQAESVLHLTTSEEPRRACALVRRFLAGESVSAGDLTAVAYAANAANAAAAAAKAANAYYAAANAANAYYAAAYAANTYYAAANAANAANAAAYAANAHGDSLARAHHVIDRFEAITGTKAVPVPPEVTTAAVAQMVRA